MSAARVSSRFLFFDMCTFISQSNLYHSNAECLLRETLLHSKKFSVPVRDHG
jgi:hypothetical protein